MGSVILSGEQSTLSLKASEMFEGLSEAHAVCQEMPLMETKPCPCEVYNSRPVSNWSSCLTNGSSGCGLGTRYRAVGCYNDKDQMVDPR